MGRDLVVILGQPLASNHPGAIPMLVVHYHLTVICNKEANLAGWLLYYIYVI